MIVPAARRARWIEPSGTGSASGISSKSWIKPDDGNYNFPLTVNNPKDLKKLQSIGLEPVLDLP